LKPGQTCGQIAEALLAVQAELQGQASLSAEFGGGMAGEPLLALRAGNDTVLEPGMVIGLAPMLNVPSDRPGAGGYGLQDLLIVTEDGCETLSDFPLEPEPGAGL
jgi:Xaa-Pro aminopeptidase